MGYNIDRIKIISSDGFGVFPTHLPQLRGEECPDSWETPSDTPSTIKGPWRTDEAGFATPRLTMGQSALSFPWYGDWSGQVFDTLLEKVLPRFDGRADMVLVWAGGDSISGLRVVDGVVTRHKVVQALGEPE